MKNFIDQISRSLVAPMAALGLAPTQALTLDQRLARAARKAPQKVINAAAMLTAQANLLETKVESEQVAPPAYQVEGNPGWPFGNAPLWSTGVKYYMQSLRLHLKSETGCDYGRMKTPHDLIATGRAVAINMILAHE